MLPSCLVARALLKKCELLFGLGVRCMGGLAVCLLWQADRVCMYAHMLEMQERNATLEKIAARQAIELQQQQKHHSQQQQQQHSADRLSLAGPNVLSAANAHAAAADDEYSDDDDGEYDDQEGSSSSSDGIEHTASDGDNAADHSGSDSEREGEGSAQPADFDTTDALAGAAREALRIDPSAGDAAASAFLLKRLLESCIRRMTAQEELLQHAMAAAQPVSTTSDHGESLEECVARLRGALVGAIKVAHSFIHDNAMIQADAAERESQVGGGSADEFENMTQTRCSSSTSAFDFVHQVVSAVAAFLQQHARDVDTLQSLAGDPQLPTDLSPPTPLSSPPLPS
jgi:hypothetical protein